MPSLSRLRTTVLLLLSLAAGVLAAGAQTSSLPLSLNTPLLLPSGVAFDSSGNLFVAERARHVIRRLSPAGALTVVAGTGAQGFSGDGGPATQATLNGPTAMAPDPQGNLFFADTGNHRIRRVDAVTGLITTVAGNGRPGFSGDLGPATAASLRAPAGLALDATGALLLADTGNHRIRRVDPTSGLITTVAGTGAQALAGDGTPATAAAFDTPTGLALTPAGDLLVADTGNNRIRHLAVATGQLTTLIGSSAATVLHAPVAVAVDAAGSVFLAESAQQRILRFDPTTSTLADVAGSGIEAFTGDGAAASAAALDTPAGLALAPDSSLVVSDSGNGRLRRLSSSALGVPVIQTVAGPGALPSPTLTLSGASVASYGSGALIAALGGSTTAPAVQESVTLLDLTAAGATSVVTATTAGGYVSLPTASLSAGTHHLVASFPGDSAHAPANSPVWILAVQPLTVTATPTAATMLFGQTPPPLTGVLTGLLAADASRVSAVFASAATAATPPGSYPIQATLTGAAAADYTLALAPASVMIAKAPTLIAIDAPGASPTALTLHVTSTTSGTPTGSLTLSEAGATLATGTLDATGRLSLSLQGLAAGPHRITALYAGDPDFLPSPSASLSLSIAATPPAAQPDFTLQPATAASVSVLAGASATIPLTIATTNGTMPGPIALAVSGVPAFAAATFDPPVVVPGAASATVTLTITTAASAHLHSPAAARDTPWQPLLCVLAVPLACLRRRVRCLGVVAALVATLTLAGCGDRVFQGTTVADPAPTVYTVTVTGTTTTLTGALLQHSTAIQLSVRP